ncbi:MAG TPA: alginate lyase family protein [Pyrinomonadaceae bacterium]|nr:alginate lyase family protein [Pyrinomonadaceae bacterium]
MANPLDKIRKLKGRSLREIRARGGQALSVYTEQIGLSGKLPTDEEFAQLIDKSFFGGNAPNDREIFAAFFKHGKNAFFQSFAQKEKTLEAFRKIGAESRGAIIEQAERMIEGKFDLLGFKNLNFDSPVNWHFEPVARKHLPLKHWKQFDELDATETGDKKIVWELNRHQHFFTLGAAYWLTGDENYAEAFTRHLDGWMEQNPPGAGINWVSSLEVAFRAISWLWAFHFFEGARSFSPALFRKSLKFLYVHARHIEKYLSTYYSPNTHLTGEALGLYYLGTQLAFLQPAHNWRETGAEILFAELDRQILPDGVYFEQSTWYARYTADFYTHFLILKVLNDEESDREREEKLEGKLQLLLNYLMQVTRPDGTTPLVGDDDGGRSLPFGCNRGAPNDFRAVLATGAVVFERGDYKFVAGGAPAEETLWLLGREGVESFEDLDELRPLHASKSFESGGYFVMRDGWDATDNYFLIDCGSVGALSGGHGHADTLAFDLAAGGKTMLVDPGTYTYHESEELRNYFRSTPAHNALVIDSESSSQTGGKFSWRTMAKPEVKAWISENRFDFFEGAHDGYRHLPDAPVTTTARAVLFLKNDYWIMRDFAETRGEHDYRLNFHFKPETNPKIVGAEDGRFYVDEETEKKSGLRLAVVGDKGGWQMSESRVSDCYGRRAASPFLQFQAKGAAAQEFFTFLLPTDSLDARPEISETEMLGGRAFIIKYRGYTDIFIYGDGERVLRTEFFDSDFRFAWARLGGEGEDLPEEFVLIDGKNFVIGNREIVNYPQTLKFVSARRLGNKLNVRTSESIFSLSLPARRAGRYLLKNSDQSE